MYVDIYVYTYFLSTEKLQYYCASEIELYTPPTYLYFYRNKLQDTIITIVKYSQGNVITLTY